MAFMSMVAPTKYLQFPFQFDAKRLVNDLNIALQSDWVEHYNKKDYEGEWTSIALYSSNGDSKNIFALPIENQALQETEILQKCLYFKEVLAHFECPLLSVRLLRLNAGAVIKPHRDYNLGYEDGQFRIHVPIVTHPNIEFMLGGQRLDMKAGSCWYTNVNYVHSVANKGTIDRVHLVFDGERNEWSDQLFFSLAPEESFLPPPPPAPSKEELKRMIEELQQQGNEAAKELIRQYQEQISKIQ